MMRAAEHTEDPDLRLQLARQATLELMTAYTTASHSEVTRRKGTIEHLDEQANPPSAGDVATFEALARLFARLERHIDTRTAREELVARWLRSATPAVLLILATWYLWAPANIARSQVVSASSLCSLTPDSPLGRPPLHRVVDGRRDETRFAVCTTIESRPWVTVDLGQRREIDRVVVFPRNDCCYGDLELPVSIQLSTDNTNFVSIGSINSPATTDTPWRFSAPAHSTARYVRMTTDTAEPRQIVIGEIEVYGR